jgi:hypothetical protein
MKQLDFQVHLQNYELALSEEIGRNRGPKVLISGLVRANGDAPYPGELG